MCRADTGITLLPTKQQNGSTHNVSHVKCYTSNNPFKLTCICQCVVHELHSRQVLQVILCLLVKIHNITLHLPAPLQHTRLSTVSNALQYIVVDYIRRCDTQHTCLANCKASLADVNSISFCASGTDSCLYARSLQLAISSLQTDIATCFPEQMAPTFRH